MSAVRDLPERVPDAPRRLQRAAGTAAAQFRRVDVRTRLQRLHQSGCLKLRFPRLPRPGAEAILINSSGGLTGGDRLSQDFTLSACADLTVTTQACERIYRAADGDPAQVRTRATLGDGARFAWLPQETILFDGGRVRRSLELDAAPDARFLLCESLILGRELMGETVATGHFHDRWRIRRAGRLVFADDLRLDGDIARDMAEPASLGPNRALATIVACLPDGEARLDWLRATIGENGGASLVGGLLVARIRTRSGFSLRKRLIPVLSGLADGPLPLVWSL
ncbi:urease accessory protein UreD [Aurantimonas sp. A2-1-M11]|uniref:urease accessory protein UreD n=1 Tax=Aurantimonas sp. A2-1-M11 TaxID=3113712 RepID=UPI002F9528BF